MIDDTVSWAALYDETRLRFAADGLGDHEARWIVEEASGSPAHEWARPATQRGVAHLDAMIERRLRGEPLQYVLGHWPFRQLDLLVDSRVLIPRPETEELVGWALDLIGPVPEPTVADLGTGSGAIALAIASEHPGAQVWATEREPDAIAVARANTTSIGRNAATRVRLVEGSWFEPLPISRRGEFDLVVSNPPYVADDDELDPVMDWEPRSALRSGRDGLSDLRTIISEAPAWLRPGGVVLVEHGASQSDEVCALAEAADLTGIRVWHDMGGHPRAMSGHRRGARES